MILAEVSFNKPLPSINMGDRLFLIVNGNLRPWIVEGYNAAKTSFVVSATFGS